MRLQFINADRLPHKSSREALDGILRKVAEGRLLVDVLDTTYGSAECPSLSSDGIVYKIELVKMHCGCPNRALGYVCEHIRTAAEECGGLSRYARTVIQLTTTHSFSYT